MHVPAYPELRTHVRLILLPFSCHRGCFLTVLVPILLFSLLCSRDVVVTLDSRQSVTFIHRTLVFVSSSTFSILSIELRDERALSVSGIPFHVHCIDDFMSLDDIRRAMAPSEVPRVFLVRGCFTPCIRH